MTKSLRKTTLHADHVQGQLQHRVEKSFRSIEILQREAEFLEKLTSLAGLPQPDKLPEILRVAELNRLPEVKARAVLSPLENECIALIAAVVSSSEKTWIEILRKFLRDLEWDGELRGRIKKHPLAHVDTERGAIIDGIVTRLKTGFVLKLEAKRTQRFSSDDETVMRKLKGRGFDDTQITAILKGRTLSGAACRYYRALHESAVGLKTIQNSYDRYLKKNNLATSE
jgi:hypothetical protein